MELKELLSSVIRKEIFGGIIYFPSRNAQLAINENLYHLIELILKGKSFSKIIGSICRKYIVSKKEAEGILNYCLKILSAHLENYLENSDTISDWRILGGRINGIRLSSPLMLIIEVTNTCNQHCNFCYLIEERGRRNIRVMPKEKIFNIIDQASEMKVFKIQYMGGEPLCRNDFLDILSYSSQKGLYVSFTTNGLLLDKFIKGLLGVQRLLPIQVSIHGDCESSLGAYAILATEWERTIKNCRLLKKYNIPFGIKAVISRLNYKHLLRLLGIFNDLGAKTVTLLHLLPIGGGKTMGNFIRFTETEVESIVKQVNTAQRRFPNIYIDYRPFLNVYFPRQPRTELDRFLNCPAGNLDLRIRYDGKVLQCSSLRTPIDDINIRSLQDIWGSIRGKMLPCPYECNKVFQCIKSY
jgi:MoaA/NifB/PqqE/SkfB family radical SAM enzyme